MTDFHSLADRLEAATAPHRELDAEIAPLAGLRLVDEGHPLGRCCYDGNGHGVPLPAFTASIDAAMSLVPEPGKPWGVYHFSGAYMAFVETAIGKSATPALALCAAALRARAAQ